MIIQFWRERQSLALKARLGGILSAWLRFLIALGCVAFAHAASAQYGTLDLTWGGAGTGYVSTPILATTAPSGDDNGRAIAVQLDNKVIVAGGCWDGTLYRFCVVRYNPNGTLDTTFNGTGIATVAIASGDAAGNFQTTSIALQALNDDLTIIVARACPLDSARAQLCAVRFKNNGSQDMTFGQSGLLKTTLTTPLNRPAKVGVQSTGKLLLGGYCSGTLCVVRYDENGQALDTTFASAGVLMTPLIGSFSRETYAMELFFDLFYIGGSCFVSATPQFCLARYNQNGQIDGSFGAGGSVVTDVAPSDDYAYAIAVQPDGKILLVGQSFNTISGSTIFDFSMVRYTYQGVVDTSFGTNGRVITRIGTSYSVGRAVVAQADGRIVVAGSCSSFATPDRVCLAGYDANGNLDTSFAGGIVQSSFLGSRDEAYAMAIQRSGQLVVAGRCRNSSGRFQFCVARYQGSPTGGLQCLVNLDLDIDSRVTLGSDSLMHARLTAGVRGSAVVSNAAPFASNTWGTLYPLLQRSSLDLDGDGAETATDSIIHARVAAGFTGTAVTNGISFAANAKRKTWADLRAYLNDNCGMALP